MGRGVLLIVSGFIIIFGLVQNTTQNRQQVLAERSPEYFYEKQTSNIAATMIEIAIGKLNGAPNNATGVATDMDGTSEEVLGEGNGTGYIYTDAIEVFGSRIIIRAIGEIEKPDGSLLRTTIKTELNRNAFSIYSYFTDIEPTIYFTTGDEINGPVHTNGTFNIRGEPVFNGSVSSPNMWEDGGYSANPDFNGTTDFNSLDIPFPDEATDAAERAQNGGLKFDDKIKVEFKNDATVDITEYPQTGSEQRCVSYYWWGGCAQRETFPTYSATGTTQNYNLNDPTFNGAISSDGQVEVKGTLDGQVTLHSGEDVRIIGDIRYKNQNISNPDDPNGISDDLLGIVSDGNTIVDKNAHQDEGSFNLDISASIMTLGESFEVEDHNEIPGRGTLNLTGGIIQKRRGPVGGLGNDGSIISGYSKNYSYDERLLENSTEGFPRQERFRVRYWDESIERVPASN